MEIKRHFCATGAVFNDRGEILMIRHKKLGVWLMPGGHVEENETPDAAVVREVFEETGVTARIRKTGSLDLTQSGCEQLATPFVVLLEDIEGDGRHMHIDLIYVLDATDTQLHSDPAEITGIGWFTPEKAIELAVYENVRRTILRAAVLVAADCALPHHPRNPCMRG